MQKKGFFQIQIWKLPDMHWEAKVTLWEGKNLPNLYDTCQAKLRLKSEQVPQILHPGPDSEEGT